jgi:hypothetical protein
MGEGRRSRGREQQTTYSLPHECCPRPGTKRWAPQRVWKFYANQTGYGVAPGEPNGARNRVTVLFVLGRYCLHITLEYFLAVKPVSYQTLHGGVPDQACAVVQVRGIGWRGTSSPIRAISISQHRQSPIQRLHPSQSVMGARSPNCLTGLPGSLN